MASQQGDLARRKTLSLENLKSHAFESHSPAKLTNQFPEGIFNECAQSPSDLPQSV